MVRGETHDPFGWSLPGKEHRLKDESRMEYPFGKRVPIELNAKGIGFSSFALSGFWLLLGSMVRACQLVVFPQSSARVRFRGGAEPVRRLEPSDGRGSG